MENEWRPRRCTLTISESFRVRAVHSSFHLQSYSLFQCHFNLKYNQKSRKTGSKSVAKGNRHSATQASDWLRLCRSNPISTVVNLLHCRLLSPDSTDCTPRALQSPVKYCCLSGTSQLQFSSFCLAKISYNATHI